jgi:hypothetical protein
MARVPRTVGVKAQADPLHLRAMSSALGPFTKQVDWEGRPGARRTAGARRGRATRLSKQRLDAFFAEIDR